MEKSLVELVQVVKRLRAPDGCPWDKEQTFESLKPHIIEEAYELTEAMSGPSREDLREELGDVLLHVVMLSNMAEEESAFALVDVISDITTKMIRRHPHVFGDTKVASVDEVWENWEKIKTTEKKQSIFESIPKALPALMASQKIQKKVARLGFDWPDKQGPVEKLKEEVQEFCQAYTEGVGNPEEELGDILFSVVNMARKMGFDSEGALLKSNQKFKERFECMNTLLEEGQTLSGMDIEQLESLWQQAKAKAKAKAQ